MINPCIKKKISWGHAYSIPQLWGMCNPYTCNKYYVIVALPSELINETRRFSRLSV